MLILLLLETIVCSISISKICVLIFLYVHCSGHNYIGSEHLLLGLLREGEGVAARVLESLGADPNNIRTQASSLLISFLDYYVF